MLGEAISVPSNVVCTVEPGKAAIADNKREPQFTVSVIVINASFFIAHLLYRNEKKNK